MDGSGLFRESVMTPIDAVIATPVSAGRKRFKARIVEAYQRRFNLIGAAEAAHIATISKIFATIKSGQRHQL